jgi:hypothetical protein
VRWAFIETRPSASQLEVPVANSPRDWRLVLNDAGFET